VSTDLKKGNEKPYALLVKILKGNNLVATGKVILTHKESLIALWVISEGSGDACSKLLG
jgi:hypothetical protein